MYLDFRMFRYLDCKQDINTEEGHFRGQFHYTTVRKVDNMMPDTLNILQGAVTGLVGDKQQQSKTTNMHL